MSLQAKQLEASRRLAEELALDHHHQEMEKRRIENELDILRKSRKQFIDSTLASSRFEYQTKLHQDPKVTEEFFTRQKKAEESKSRTANEDFKIERKRLEQERKEYDILNQRFEVVQKDLLNLQMRSRVAEEQEQRRLMELELKRKSVLALLDESKQQELFHFERFQLIR